MSSTQHALAGGERGDAGHTAVRVAEVETAGAARGGASGRIPEAPDEPRRRPSSSKT
jgi:hypothetical protein